MKHYLSILLCLVITSVIAQDSTTFIRVNLVGYTNSAPKKALIISKEKIKVAFFIYAVPSKTKTPIKTTLSKNQPWDPFPYNYMLDLKTVRGYEKTYMGAILLLR